MNSILKCNNNFIIIEEATKPVKINTKSDEEVFYAIFSIRRSANVFDSALCMYKMTNIEETLKGRFKNNPQKSSLINPLDSCSSYKSMNSIEVDNYYKDIIKNEKFQIEQTINQKALFALNNVKFTSIAVDASNKHGHVVFLGLSDGRLLKVMNQIVDSRNQPIILAEFQMFPKSLAVNSVLLFDSKRVVAVTSEQISAFSLESQCQKYKTCAQCVYAQDPYCAWSTSRAECVFSDGNEVLLQDIFNGDLKKCGINDAVYYSLSEETDNLVKIKSSSSSHTSSSIIFLIIIFTVILTSLLSACSTWFYIKKRYDTYLRRGETKRDNETDFKFGTLKFHELPLRLRLVFNRLVETFVRRLRRSNNQTLEFKDNLEHKPKILNCYEKTSKITVVCTDIHPSSSLTSRPNSSSDDHSSPTTTSSLTVSSSSNNNSPNNSKCSCEFDEEVINENGNLLTPVLKYPNMDQALLSSSSQDSFEPSFKSRHSQASNRNTAHSNISGNKNNTKRYVKILDSKAESSTFNRELDL